MGVELIGKNAAYKLQVAARHEMILKLLQDIRMDIAVCEVEGWDKTEYIRMLQDELNHFKTKGR